jgi:transcriptional regulator with XRE-family HTH domain
MARDSFPELLGQLKERSGLSYGVLGKRLHMSASTLHRYVNGDAVPADYAPIERFARACKATPEELVELHRRWVLADARRRDLKEAAASATSSEPAVSAPEEVAPKGVAPKGVAEAADKNPEPTPEPAPESAPESGTQPDPDAVPAPAPAPTPAPEPGAGTVPQPKGSLLSFLSLLTGRHRRTVVLAGAGAVAVVLAAALVLNLVTGDGNGDDDGDDGQVKQRVGGAASPSLSTSASPSRGPGASESGGTVGGSTGAPLVATDPYYWDSACKQHYLVDRDPAQVPPPPFGDEARGWVTALGGVAAGEQWVRLTVRGAGKNTVVLEGLHVRVVGKDAPLAWNDYRMGVDGCDGGGQPKHFGTNLDAGRPTVTPKAGQRDFPYKVSDTDSEVYYVAAGTQTHDVSWYLEMDWTSGNQHGKLRIDDRGKPFRTSGNLGRPAYDYPLGYNDKWEVADGKPGAPTG